MIDRLIKILPVALISIIALTATFSIIGNRHSKRTTVEMANAAVAITSPSERSGGTGVILASTPAESYILTNNHVCHVVVNGGIVKTDNDKKYEVVSYRPSAMHDLCLITVKADLGVTTAIADKAPELYEDASIAGHPNLFPSVITHGHFSKHERGDVVIGTRECTEEEKRSGAAMFCMFMGGIPVVKSYEMQLVTATIMAGSSGSAVYNSRGQLSGLVFAGQGDLGYAFIVPYEYVAGFLNDEVEHVIPLFPNTTRSIASEL